MTDFEKAKELFDGFNIGYIEEYDANVIYMVFKAKESQNVDGYNGFEASLIFTKQGEAIKMDVYE